VWAWEEPHAPLAALGIDLHEEALAVVRIGHKSTELAGDDEPVLRVERECLFAKEHSEAYSYGRLIPEPPFSSTGFEKEEAAGTAPPAAFPCVNDTSNLPAVKVRK
jgi:hypothetical protein